MGITGMVALAMDPELSPSLAMPYVIKNAMPGSLDKLNQSEYSKKLQS